MNEPAHLDRPGLPAIERLRSACAGIEFFGRGNQLLWAQSRKVRKQTRVETCPDNRIKRRSAFSSEFKDSKLLAVPKRIVSLVLRSREAVEFVEKKRREAALILPDYCARVAVLDFDSFPADPKEQLSLVRFRLATWTCLQSKSWPQSPLVSSVASGFRCNAFQCSGPT